jgi:hypothetical protein
MRFFTKIPDMSALTTLDKRYQAARAKYFRPAMEKSVESIQGTAVGEIPSVSGKTRKTMTSKVFGGNVSIVGVVTSTAREPNLGVYVLNFGRKAGSKTPSSDSLISWIRSRGIGQVGQSIEETAFLIARSIKKKGTTALHFMVHALGAKTSEINRNFADATNSIVEELDHGH